MLDKQLYIARLVCDRVAQVVGSWQAAGEDLLIFEDYRTEDGGLRIRDSASHPEGTKLSSVFSP